MDRSEAQTLLSNLDILKAFADGQTIQHNNASGWYDHPSPTFTDTPDSYRIKPRPIEGWVNVFEGGGFGMVHSTKTKALAAGNGAQRTVFVREVEA